MIDNIPYDYQHWQFMGWTGGLLASAVVISVGYAVWAKRRKKQQESSVREMLGVSDLSNSLDTKHEGQHAGRAADTLFIMPDISNYTRFVSSKHLEADDAQNIIFSLMSAIINTVGEELRFSKLEGDSALFFTNADAASPEQIGRTLLSIFAAFDARKTKLAAELTHDPVTKEMIQNLDLKIFAHRGVAQRFTYRGMVDHFGSEVTLLHKLMKNHVNGDRYVLVTEAARRLIDLHDQYDCEPLSETIEHIGQVQGCVFRPMNASKSVQAEKVSSLKTEGAKTPKAKFPPSFRNSLKLTNMKWITTMKIKTLVAAVAITFAATAAFATDYTKGTVKKIDAKSGKVTVKHEELKNLGMPAMTMVFVPKDDAVLAKLKEGGNIEFVAERVKGKLTLVEVK